MGNREIGIGLQRLLNVIERRQQRLRFLAAFAGNESDAMPLRRRIDEVDGTGRSLAGEFDARHLIAEFQRQIERDVG